jgi:hypothetical protein
VSCAVVQDEKKRKEKESMKKENVQRRALWYNTGFPVSHPEKDARACSLSYYVTVLYQFRR